MITCVDQGFEGGKGRYLIVWVLMKQVNSDEQQQGM